MPQHLPAASYARAILQARKQRGWSQTELGQAVGITQAHIWKIEAGKISPRLDTLLELFRVLEFELVPVPRAMLPVVQAVLRSQSSSSEPESGDSPRLYLADPDDEESGELS